MTPCRLIVDPPQDGAWNMAVDEALLEDAADRGEATLRFYQWAEPTLSLGYFQPYAERSSHAASRHLAAVRRLSGGGALVHDRELTYALCLPATHPLARDWSRLYQLVHESLIATLQQWQLTPALHGDRSPADAPRVATHGEAAASDEPFLCFARRTETDVVLSDGRRTARPCKIAGSAQRRRRGAILQHGGILLGQSPAAPELPGIAELAAASIPPEELVSGWTARLAAATGLAVTPEPLPGRLIDLAQRLRLERYADPSWTRRR